MQSVEWDAGVPGPGSRGVWKGGPLTPVTKTRLALAPVLHSAVIHILCRGNEGQVVELVESEFRAGQKDSLRSSLSDQLPVTQPCDIEHRGKEPVDVADEDVGLAQLYWVLGEHGHFGRLWEEREPGQF